MAGQGIILALVKDYGNDKNCIRNCIIKHIIVIDRNDPYEEEQIFLIDRKLRQQI